MKADLLYESIAGRLLLQLIQRSGSLKLAAALMRSPVSKCLIRPYIESNQIDMTEFEGQHYDSFASFFARKKDWHLTDCVENDLISPCDSLLSIFPVKANLEIPMKGSRYTIKDLVPDPKQADAFAGGLCLVFRLEASDYHHFCYFDDCLQRKTHKIPGQLHSVQPIACRHYPVYRLNRRWWTILETKHFGKAAHIEVGAMLVGGVTHAHEGGVHRKGSEMGNFELWGSTIAVLLTADTRKNLIFEDKIGPAMGGIEEVRVKIGEVIGHLKDENRKNTEKNNPA